MHTFELIIQRRYGESWPVIVEEHAGDGTMPVRVEGELALDQHQLLALDTDAAAYGEALGRALFTEPIRDAFVEALARAPERLRVLLFVEDQPLRGLRWERLRAPVDGSWRPLATFQRAPLTRYLPSLTDRRFPPIGRRDLRAVILAASPGNLGRFGLAEFDAAQAVDSARRALGDIPAVVLADIPGAAGRPTLDALCATLTAESITLLHIVAHGRVLQDGESVVYLSGAESPAAVDPVTCTRLVERLGALQSARGLPHFTFLATCDSASPDADEAMGGLGQRLVVELGMPAVVAMSDKVSVDTAHALSAELYRRLREHGEPDRALVEATAGLAECGDVMVPALFSRLGGRPLFSELADRPLTQAEIEAGLDRLAALLPERAPVLVAELSAAAGSLRRTGRLPLAALSADVRAERAAALERAATICAEAADISFSALALGEPPLHYDPRCPFPGLRAFNEDRVDFFFGREALVGQLAGRLADHPFLAVLGPSGSGKSSVVFAGLVPELQRRHPGLPAISFTPGELPLASLVYALEASGAPQSGPAPRGLIVIDQFEELFTLCPDADERRAFLQELLKLPGSYLVVITMRADFWGEVAPYRELRELVQARQVLVPPMSPEELRRAIELQAAAVGLRFEADLGGQILDDVRGEPGAMPLLQHALQELWQRRRGRWLRGAEYRAIGGVQRAIAHTADAIYAGCTPDEQERIRAIFLRLTHLDREGGEERRDTRQRVSMRDLVPASAEPGPTQALVSRLADARLVITSGAGGGDTVEVAHEALIRGWPRLRTWLTEDRQALLLRESIEQAAREWDASGHDESFLFRGARLDEGLALGTQQRFGLNALECAFLEAAEALRTREAQEREAARQRDLESARMLAETEARRAREAQEATERMRRSSHVLKIVAGVALALMVLAVAAGVSSVSGHATARVQAESAEAARDEAHVALNQAEQAQADAEKARADAEKARDESSKAAVDAAQRALLADAEAALERGNPERALALSLASLESSNPALDAYLTLAIATDSAPRRRFANFTGSVTALAFSPSGDLMIGGDADGNVYAWDPKTGDELRHYQAPGQPDKPSLIVGFAFLPDRTGIVIATHDGNMVLLDAVGGKPLSEAHPFEGGSNERITALAISRDGRTVFTGGEDGAVTAWDVAQRAAVGPVTRGRGSRVVDLGINTEGQLIVLHEEGLLQIVRSQDQPPEELVLEHTVGLGGTEETIRCRASAMDMFSDDKHLLVGCDDGLVELWDLSKREFEIAFSGHDSTVLSISIAPDGNHFVTTSYDQTVRLWDFKRQIELRRFVGHDGEANVGLISPDGRYLLTGAFDATVRQWDLRGGQMQFNLISDLKPDSRLVAVSFSPDGETVAAARKDALVGRWKLSDGTDQGSLDTGEQLYALSADARLALIGLGNQGSTPSPLGGELFVRSVDENATISTLPVVPGAKRLWAAFSPDNRYVALSFDDRRLQLWQVADGALVRRFDLDSHQGGVLSMAFSPDGRYLLTGTDNYNRAIARLWDVRTGHLVARLEGHRDEVTAVAFSADGKFAATGSWDRTVRLWDLTTFRSSRQFVGHGRSIQSVALSPNGKFLLSGSEDDTARLWEVATGRELGRFTGLAGDVVGVAFGLGGGSAVTATSEGEVLLWKVQTGLSLAKWSRENRYVPELSCGERKRYLLSCAHR